MWVVLYVSMASIYMADSLRCNVQFLPIGRQEKNVCVAEKERYINKSMNECIQEMSLSRPSIPLALALQKKKKGRGTE